MKKCLVKINKNCNCNFNFLKAIKPKLLDVIADSVLFLTSLTTLAPY